MTRPQNDSFLAALLAGLALLAAGSGPSKQEKLAAQAATPARTVATPVADSVRLPAPYATKSTTGYASRCWRITTIYTISISGTTCSTCTCSTVSTTCPSPANASWLPRCCATTTWRTKETSR